MSASTVSITANPAAWRRPIVLGEKKSGIEFVGGDGGAAVATSGGGGGDDKVTNSGGIGKDLSHSIRGEAVLERSRDLVQVKKALPNSTTLLPRRTTRKVVSKPEKSWWQTLISVFTKNFLLLLALLGLVQMICRLVIYGGNSPTVPPSAGISDLESRIVEVESFLKSTTKMMQIQVEVVDRKIENQIGGLRRELSKKIEDRGEEFFIELKKLDGITESLENKLDDLRATNWLAKQDFDKFFDEFKETKGFDQGNRDVSLDEIRAFAREIVEKEIEKHAADGLGRVDYALASGGAMVMKHSEPYIVGRGTSWFYMKNWNGVHSDAEKMLRPSFGEPGQCFPFKGSMGFVQIKLRMAIIPEAITLEHVAKLIFLFLQYERCLRQAKCSQGLQGVWMAARARCY
ncbi:hypothetical protein F0562_017955 [Nyssa sinensis]|uniref:SUN domain-containing protein n=1 Tax=Nyssa sinensis TaxID=561372 RepID=A0A5J4ZAQ8_9ASTE|nr:hypothetical protein F0562_017955 [Nyssa sinensis]